MEWGKQALIWLTLWVTGAWSRRDTLRNPLSQNVPQIRASGPTALTTRGRQRMLCKPGKEGFHPNSGIRQGLLSRHRARSLLLRTLQWVLVAVYFPQSESQVSETLFNLESYYVGKIHSLIWFRSLLSVTYLPCLEHLTQLPCLQTPHLLPTLCLQST